MNMQVGDERGSDADVRPIVAVRSSRRAVWLLAAGLALTAVLLFVALESGRSARIQQIANIDAGVSGLEIASPPPLAVPQDTLEYASGAISLYPVPSAPALTNAPQDAYRLPRQIFPLQHTDSDPDNVRVIAPPQVAVGVLPPPPMPLADPFAGEAIAGRAGERVQATRFANPATTVPKGTVVQAVLETALDSTRPGFARAIVSRDVAGFDGTQILIPRGSRLIGDYKADLQPGQKRALIQWQRLTRPDGVIINLDSPSADPLGRSGVEGKVNSHFLERFGGSMLQSAMTIGTQVAINKASDGNVIYAIPLTGQITPSVTSERVQPTLKVRQGTSVSVFVARDLDFTTVSP